MDEPTAVQSLGEMQDTPLKWLAVAPGGSGTASAIQLDPFQTSARA
jgi:hypothetical protein